MLPPIDPLDTPVTPDTPVPPLEPETPEEVVWDEPQEPLEQQQSTDNQFLLPI